MKTYTHVDKLKKIKLKLEAADYFLKFENYDSLSTAEKAELHRQIETNDESHDFLASIARTNTQMTLLLLLLYSKKPALLFLLMLKHKMLRVVRLVRHTLGFKGR